MALTKIPTHMLYSGAASEDLSIDSNTLFIDSSTNRVGIVNNSPSVALDVTGAAKISSTLDLTSHLDMPDSANIKLGTGDDLQIYHDGSNSRITNATGQLWLQSDTGIRFTDLGVNESMAAFYDNGAVELYYDGSKKLETASGGIDVTGTISSSDISITSTGPSISLIDSDNNPDYQIKNGNGAFRIIDTTNSLDKINITTSSNVFNVASQGSAFDANDNSTWNALEIFQDRGVTNSGSGIAFRSQSGTSPAGIVSVAGNTTGGIESLAFVTVASNVGVERMRVTSDGKVGIGTASPSNKLTVRNDAAASVPLMIENRNETDNDTTSIGFLNQDPDNDAGYVPVLIGTKATDASDRANDLLFAVANADNASYASHTRMTIKNTGNVGIGTTSPGALLHLYNSSNAQITFQNSTTGTTVGSDGYDITVQGNDVYHILRDSGFQTWYTDNTRRMTLDSGGKLGIGTTDPDEALHVEGSMMLDAYNVGAEEGIFFREGFSDSNKYNLGIMTYAHGGSSVDGITIGSYNGFSVCTGSNSRQERFRINATGDVIIAGTAVQAQGSCSWDINVRCPVQDFNLASHIANAEFMVFRNQNTQIGSVTAPSGGSSTAFNTSSDYRLKENVSYSWDATTRLKQLKPARFNWILDDTNTLEDGFLAHEVQAVVPNAVTGTKDQMEDYVDDEGETQQRVLPQQIDHSKLVPLLVKTIQELEARIKTLEDG